VSFPAEVEDVSAESNCLMWKSFIKLVIPFIWNFTDKHYLTKNFFSLSLLSTESLKWIIIP